MKTFEEALATVILVGKKAEMTPEKQEEIARRLIEDAQRHESLIREAHANRHLTEVLLSLIGKIPPEVALLNAFLIGLRTGMEMERSETGGVIDE